MLIKPVVSTTLLLEYEDILVSRTMETKSRF